VNQFWVCSATVTSGRTGAGVAATRILIFTVPARQGPAGAWFVIPEEPGGEDVVEGRTGPFGELLSGAVGVPANDEGFLARSGVLRRRGMST
jgi:hypothetical protein